MGVISPFLTVWALERRIFFYIQGKIFIAMKRGEGFYETAGYKELAGFLSG
jgi:hypothetical protein